MLLGFFMVSLKATKKILDLIDQYEVSYTYYYQL